jgi:hypothetical protein
VDSYMLLADPEAMHLIPSFPIGLLTRDGCWNGALTDRAEFALRAVLASVVLHVRSRSRDVRAFEKSFMALLQRVFARPTSDSKEADY